MFVKSASFIRIICSSDGQSIFDILNVVFFILYRCRLVRPTITANVRGLPQEAHEKHHLDESRNPSTESGQQDDGLLQQAFVGGSAYSESSAGWPAVSRTEAALVAEVEATCAVISDLLNGLRERHDGVMGVDVGLHEGKYVVTALVDMDILGKLSRPIRSAGT